MANVVYLSKTLRTGGTAPALDSIDGTGLVDGDIAHVTLGGVSLEIYKLKVGSAGPAGSFPPATNPGTKKWELIGVVPIFATAAEIATGTEAAKAIAPDQLALSSPTFVGATLSGATASLPAFFGASKELVSKSVADTRTALGVGTAGPAFLVRCTGSQTDIAPNGYVQVNWDAEIFDKGSNFTTDTFTAPVTGLYQLNVFVSITNIQAVIYYVRLTMSNRNVLMRLIADKITTGGTYDAVLGGLFDMDAADTALVHVYQDGGSQVTDIGSESFFSGFLVW